MTKKRGQGLGPVLLTVVLDLVGFGLVIPLLTFYAEDYGATAIQVGLLMASYSIAQFLFAPFWGALSDRMGRRPVMLASIAGTTIFLAAFAAADSLAMLFLFRTLHGASAANISTAQAYVADITDKDSRSKGMGLIGASFGIGFSLGPWIGGELSVYGLS
ncbi:MAG: MFS transporter, partial [Rhodobacterales bacterium]|nr:MFS transporter [Rhodobacterales bacterium]